MKRNLKGTTKATKVSPEEALNDIRHLEKIMIQNNMGSLNDLDETDYFELTNVFNSEEKVQSLGDFLSDLGY